MANNGNTGANSLAQLLTSRMAQAGKTSLVLDFGEIGRNYELITNTFPVPIPRNAYSVCQKALGVNLELSGGAHDGHSEGNGAHSHSADIPGIIPGSRVLVAWVQQEAVVIDQICSAERL